MLIMLPSGDTLYLSRDGCFRLPDRALPDLADLLPEADRAILERISFAMSQRSDEREDV
jgi:hypothetical protein